MEIYGKTVPNNEIQWKFMEILREITKLSANSIGIFHHALADWSRLQRIILKSGILLKRTNKHGCQSLKKGRILFKFLFKDNRL